MIGRPVASDIVSSRAKVRWFIRYDAPECHCIGISYFNAIKSCHVNMPAGVLGEVSQTGIPASGCRMPSGLPTPSPATIAFEIERRKPSETLRKTHASIGKEL